MAPPEALSSSLAPPRRRDTRSWVLPVTGTGVGVGYLLALLQVGSVLEVLFGALAYLVFVAPGVFMVRAAVQSAAGWMVPLTFGPCIGFAFSSLTLLALWSLGVRDAWMLLAAPLLASPLVWPAHRLAGRLHVFERTNADTRCLLLLLLLVPLIVGRAFALVGAEVNEGVAYRAYFTSDYVWRRAVVAELAKGDFLPLNPFFAGDTLHYYWLPHLFSAVEYRAVGQRFGLDQILLTGSILTGPVFVAFLYGAVRLFVPSAWAAAGGVSCALLFTSAEGLYALWDHWRLGADYERLRYLNIDAVTRWMFQGMPIDGLHRVLLYQPHHALGYALGFCGLLVIARRARRVDPVMFAVAGALLGTSVLISSFGGLMFTAAAALHEAVSVAATREWRRAPGHALAAAIPLGAAAALVTMLEYVDRGGQVILVGLNPVATHAFWLSTALSFGPAFLLAGAGAWLAWRAARQDLGVLATLGMTCVVFYFFVDIRDHANVYVGWRVGHLLFMACAVPTALLLEHLAVVPGRRRGLAIGGVVLVLAASAPTVSIDLYNTQDVANRRMGPGFRWTLVLTHDELEAFEWIKRNTTPAAIFQVDAQARDSETWANLPAFAERRMAVGLPISMVPLEKYLTGTGDVTRMLRDPDASAVYTRATRFGIRYLFSGPPERAANPGLQVRLDSRSDLFPLLFRNDSISIYAVVPPRRSGL